MRKINDYYSKKAKKENYPARSVYKIEEVQQKYKFLKYGDSVLDLGCYPGSWSLFASEVIGPRGIVVGVDLQQADKSPRQNGAPIHWLCQDIMEPELLVAVRKFRPAFKVLVSDLAPKTTGSKWADAQQSLNLVRHTLSLTEELLLNNGHYLCKVFQGEDFPQFVEDVKKRFTMVKVLKPKSSRVESREVFLLGMEFKKRC
ncbi:RlmE family RNA methyltransferase [Desulforhopalus sp. IMCC35007]|uniref:SAM-dependent methyltransferase n=1 Tax=Desulforhopalus sp. IMCC35007 TaxID=2569543 RepID=UPI0010AEC681|nr:RlmE family RNA methyltransferase [Desulforhopalus sp. IMCC35007]TKB06241.1 RlmE family RNA methyltransferase [Desulforhopalus sp. IMCC35007]